MTKTGYVKGPKTHDDPEDYEEPTVGEQPDVEAPDVTTAPTKSELDVETVDVEQYRTGSFAGRPVYGCPYCPLNNMRTNADIVEHVRLQHRRAARSAQA